MWIDNMWKRGVTIYHTGLHQSSSGGCVKCVSYPMYVYVCGVCCRESSQSLGNTEDFITKNKRRVTTTQPKPYPLSISISLLIYVYRFII